MALAPKFDVKQQPLGLSALFTDKTGDFSANNVGGWGSPNPLKSSVTAATLDIYFPLPTTGLPDKATSTTTQVDLFARSYPTKGEITLTPADFLESVQIQDGIYLFELIVTSTSSVEPVTPIVTVHEAVAWYGGFYRNTECCADRKIKTGCKCDKNKFMTDSQVTVMWMRTDFYSIALNETYCQDEARMAEALLHAMDLCTNNCKDCGC